MGRGRNAGGLLGLWYDASAYVDSTLIDAMRNMG